MSEAVTVWLGKVLSVTLKLFTPEAKAALIGNVALLSEEVMPTVSVTLVTTFQLASTALTVRLNAVPAVWADGVPVFPLGVPGAAVSPGVNTCNLTNGPALTATLLEAALLNLPLPKTIVIVSATG